MISLIVAGYETTSAAQAWTLYASLRAPGVWERAREEVDTVLVDSEIGAELLDQLPSVDAIVQESLRLHPPVVVLPRVLAEDAEFGGTGCGPAPGWRSARTSRTVCRRCGPGRRGSVPAGGTRRNPSTAPPRRPRSCRSAAAGTGASARPSRRPS